MKRRKKFQWRMAALVTGVAMTCVMMTACSLGDNPVGGDDQPGGTYGLGSGKFKSLDDVAVGDYVFADGTILTSSSYFKDGKSLEAIGVVVYVGQDAISENGVTLRDGKTTLQSHCLVLSMREASDVVWANNSFKVELGDDNLVKSTADLKRTTDVSGYTNTKTLVEKAIENGDANLYPAAANAWNYDCATPAGSTGWFLPSAQQWAHIIAGANSLGQLDFNKVVWNDWTYEFANPGFLHKLNDKVVVELDGWNWTSSEYDWRNAVAIYFGYVDGVSSAGFQYNHKGEAKYHVRPVFAM